MIHALHREAQSAVNNLAIPCGLLVTQFRIKGRFLRSLLASLVKPFSLVLSRLPEGSNIIEAHLQSLIGKRRPALSQASDTCFVRAQCIIGNYVRISVRFGRPVLYHFLVLFSVGTLSQK